MGPSKRSVNERTPGPAPLDTPLGRLVMDPRFWGLVPKGEFHRVGDPPPWGLLSAQNLGLWLAKAGPQRQEVTHSRMGISGPSGQQNPR